MRPYPITLLLAVAIAGYAHGQDRERKPDTPERIAAKFAAITEHNRPVFALRHWGDTIIAQVKRVKWVPREKPKDQPGFATGFVWPMEEPEVYDMYMVDVAKKTMTKLTVPGIHEVIRLAMDGHAKVAFGYDKKGGPVLRRLGVDGWTDLPLPREFLEAPKRILVQSQTTLALMTVKSIHVWKENEWRTSRLPPMPNDYLNRPRPIEWAVTPNGRHFGKDFFVHWQESEFEGCLLAIDLESPNPQWKSLNGTPDLSSGLPHRYQVAAIRQGPKGSLWVARDGTYVNADVHQFDGRAWRQHWVAPPLQDYRLIDMAIGPANECYLLGARPPAKVLKVAKDQTEIVLTIPGMAMSILADPQGHLLVGTMGHDLILLEKENAGFRMHHLVPSP